MTIKIPMRVYGRKARCLENWLEILSEKIGKNSQRFWKTKKEGKTSFKTYQLKQCGTNERTNKILSSKIETCIYGNML